MTPTELTVHVCIEFALALVMFPAWWEMRRLRAVNRTDDLTSIGNHRQLRRAMARTSRGTLLIIDLNKFKLINDTFGHSVGNVVLTTVAHRLAAATQTGETAARLHGDEFAFWIGNTLDEGRTQQRIDALADTIEQPIDIDGRHLRVTASIGRGVAASRSSFSALFEAADRSMYTAKLLYP